MMHASIQCGIVPSKCHQIFQENRLTVSMLSKSYLILHFSVARCIVSIMTNTSLVSETLLTKRAILSKVMHIRVRVLCLVLFG